MNQDIQSTNLRHLQSITAEKPLVTVVLLSYARPHYLAETLPTVVEQSYENLEIIVVDNRSRFSDEIAGIVGRYPQVRLISNSENTGFTGGMNLGIRVASGQYIFLTEDDLVLDQDCVAELVRHGLASSGEVLLSGLMYNKVNGLIWSAGGNVSFDPLFKLEVIGQGEHDLGQFTHPFDVNYIAGAMVFSSARLLKELGGFRDDFFMYCEDVELCLRARGLGCNIRVVPTAKASHFEPIPGPGSDELLFHQLKNFFALHILHAPLPAFAAFSIRYVALGFLRALPNRRTARVWLEALRYTFLRAPRLWKERRLLRLGTAQLAHGVQRAPEIGWEKSIRHETD
jgi:GT2 family glycosyltransferase